MATSEQQQRNQRGVNRVLAKLESSIEAGFYYEAHQMYRTLYFRYTAQNKFADCLTLLFSGAQKLVAKQQETSAGDLGLLLVDTLEKRGGNEDFDLWIERLCVLIGRLSASTVERETLINRALKWSGDMSSNHLGHPRMHKLIARVYWTEGNTEQARHHFLLCRDGNVCGRILIKISTSKGYTNELDLFIVQAVLQQLCLKDRPTAGETFQSYTRNHPQIRQIDAPFKQPLINFVWFLLRTIDAGRVDAFRTLCELYKPSLSRDTSFEKYLAKVGVIFFGIAAPRSTIGDGGGGMFGDLFSRVFQDLDTDTDDTLQAATLNVGRRSSNTNELD